MCEYEKGMSLPGLGFCVSHGDRETGGDLCAAAPSRISTMNKPLVVYIFLGPGKFWRSQSFCVGDLRLAALDNLLLSQWFPFNMYENITDSLIRSIIPDSQVQKGSSFRFRLKERLGKPEPLRDAVANLDSSPGIPNHCLHVRKMERETLREGSRDRERWKESARDRERGNKREREKYIIVWKFSPVTLSGSKATSGGYTPVTRYEHALRLKEDYELTRSLKAAVLIISFHDLRTFLSHPYGLCKKRVPIICCRIKRLYVTGVKGCQKKMLSVTFSI